MAGTWRIMGILLALLGGMMIANCHAQQGGERIIIRFTEEVSAPDATSYINELSKSVGVPLRYLRPLIPKSNVHAFEFTPSPAQPSLKEILQQLMQRSDVVYAEADAVMSIQ